MFEKGLNVVLARMSLTFSSTLKRGYEKDFYRSKIYDQTWIGQFRQCKILIQVGEAQEAKINLEAKFVRFLSHHLMSKVHLT